LKGVWDLLLYSLLRILLFLGRVLPQALFYLLGKATGYFLYFTLPRKREIIRKNLQQATGSKEIDNKLVQKSFLHVGRVIAEFFLLPRWKREGFEEKVDFVGEERLKQAYAKGKGVILAAGHFGNWELIPPFLNDKGFSISGIVREQKLPRTNELLFSVRRELGLKLINKKGMGLRKSIEAIKEGNLLLVLVDEFTPRGIPVKFCGRVTPTPSGAAQYSKKFFAPLLPVSVRLQPSGKYQLFIGEEITTRDRSIGEIMEEVNKWLEGEIKKTPEAWLALRPRWRGRDSEVVRE